MNKNIFLFIFLVILFVLLFIAFSKSIHAQPVSNKYYAPMKEIVCDKKIMHGRNIVLTKQFTVFNKKLLSNFVINTYVVTDDIYYFVKKLDEFNAQGLRHFFKKSKIWKITKRL